MTQRIEDYALIGDCHSAALVGRDGSIDWFCAPRFDSAACFAALLGEPEHGRWLIAPRANVRGVQRRYRDQTLVLETVFETDAGSVAVIDCMPLLSDSETELPQIVRVVEGRSGEVPMQMDFVVRFEYGSVVPWVTRQAGSLRAIAGPHTLYLHTEVPLRGQGLRTTSEFNVRAGERAEFVLTYNASHRPERAPVAAWYAVERTAAAWAQWSARCSYRGEFRAEVQRSLLVLKALTYRPTGGLVAAPTSSLPEQLGGERNWDYRYCWLRDATVTLYALLAAGYTAEAGAFREWLLRAVAGSPSEMRVIYGLSGERRLTEYELDWLPGYAGSRPVRVGNAAHSQLQLDVYGELMDTMHQCRRAKLDSAQSWALECKLLTHLESLWQCPDASIWEVRGPTRHFTYSKVMTWVAFDRGIKAIEAFGQRGPIDRWRKIRDQIHAEVCERAFNVARDSFVQAYDSDALDASLLQIALVGFLPASDPRVQATVAAIQRELLIEDTFVLRYRTQPDIDGLPPGEGAFLACSFWLVNNLALQGRVEEANALFQRLLAVQNDVGLLAEEYDPAARRQLGNFPQAYSHLALLDAAQALAKAGPGTAHRATEAPLDAHDNGVST